MKRTAWIIYNDFLPGDKFSDFAIMLQEAVEALGHNTLLKTNQAILNQLDRNGFSELKERPDYVLFTDKDIYLARTLEHMGLKLFNSAQAIEISDDKMKTHQCLASENIPMPKTIIAPKTFGFPLINDEVYLQKVIKELSYPFIIKEAFGSFGEQVYLIHHEQQLLQCLEKVRNVPFMFQEFIDTSFGVDLRLQVVGDKVIAAMKRTSKNDFRANVTSGGVMAPYEPTAYEKDLAIAATKAIKADFAGVDLLFGEGDVRYVCEVNSNAHIRNLYDCTGINAANDIVKYIENAMK